MKITKHAWETLLEDVEKLKGSVESFQREEKRQQHILRAFIDDALFFAEETGAIITPAVAVRDKRLDVFQFEVLSLDMLRRRIDAMGTENEKRVSDLRTQLERIEQERKQQ